MSPSKTTKREFLSGLIWDFRHTVVEQPDMEAAACMAAALLNVLAVDKSRMTSHPELSFTDVMLCTHIFKPAFLKGVVKVSARVCAGNCGMLHIQVHV
jgi:hypothetical protein